MPAPKNNSFWKQRTKHGRDKLFSSPEILWEAACEYFEWCETHPLTEVEQVKTPGKAYKDEDGVVTFAPNVVELPKMRAFTWTGLEIFLDVSDLKNYRNNDSYKDFFPILSRVEKIIYEQKFTGAASGLLNASIIQRDLNLREQTNTELTGKDGGPIQQEYNLTLNLNK